MDFQIFKDKELTEIADPINLGKLKVGETKEFTFYVFNATVDPYEELKLNVDHKEITVISAPTELKEKTSAKFILEWKATVNVKRNLKPTLEINGFRKVPI